MLFFNLDPLKRQLARFTSLPNPCLLLWHQWFRIERAHELLLRGLESHHAVPGNDDISMIRKNHVLGERLNRVTVRTAWGSSSSFRVIIAVPGTLTP